MKKVVNLTSVPFVLGLIVELEDCDFEPGEWIRKIRCDVGAKR